MVKWNVLLMVILLWVGSLQGCTETIGSGPDSSMGSLGESCGAVRCASNEFCCRLTGVCHLLEHASACSRGLSDASVSGCLSNLDCADSEFCDGRTCLGVGFCTARRGATCAGAPSFECGCDGVTYSNACDRLAAGARLAVGAMCGSLDASADVAGVDGSVIPIGCASNSQCPLNFACCAATGTCQPVGCRDCCLTPLTDGGIPCVRNEQCLNGGRYCAGVGCGSIGVCVISPPRSDCDGTLEPVCGCDGRTYSNRCWAAAGGARVASPGACR